MVEAGKVMMLVLISDCGIRRPIVLKKKIIPVLASPAPHGLG